MNSSYIRFYIQQFIKWLLILDLLFSFVDTNNTGSVFKLERFTTVTTSYQIDTGACPHLHVESEAACAMQCYFFKWCRVYVMGSCDLGVTNLCLCMICHKDPVITTDLGTEHSIGTITTPKRLLDGFCSLAWDDVDSNCTMAVADISSNFSSSPILSLRLIAMETNIFGSVLYSARPVCPPDFTVRGVTSCHSTEGFWRDQDTLACFPMACAQEHNGVSYYAGWQNFTESGRPCWMWKDDAPFYNDFVNSTYMFDDYDIRRAKNYCRVFLDQDQYSAPWCYNADYDEHTDPLRHESCGIPQCYDVY